MGFVRRLNSKELVGDPCSGAEVYPITATNAVYREGGENLESILTRLGNNADRKVVQNVTSTNGVITVTFTDGTSETIYQTKSINTNNNTALTPDNETVDGNGTIDLHKVAKTGNYNDLLNLPQGFGAYPTVTAEWDSTNEINKITFRPEISNQINVITLKPDSNHYFKCVITSPEDDDTWSKYDWSEGKVIIQVDKTEMFGGKPYLLVSNTSVDRRNLGATAHWVYSERMPNVTVDSTDYYKFPLNLTNATITRPGFTAMQNYFYTIAECKVFQGAPYDDTTIFTVEPRCSFSIIPEFTNPVCNNNKIQALQYCESEQEYNDITNKDPNTLYFIPVENS